jgi:hypothetical protein
MWNLLKKADIEQAKQDLKLRRSEILRRHVEESQNLETDRTELEKLNLLADLFTQKYKIPSISAHAPVPVSTQKIGDKSSPEARHQHHRHQPQPQHQPKHQHQPQQQTVFATFMRAASRV